MVGRIVAFALVVAGLVLGTGAFAWSAHVRVIDALVHARSEVARGLLSAGEERPLEILHAVLVPGVHVIVEDHTGRSVYEAVAGGPVIRRPIVGPPPGVMGPGPPPVSGPPEVVRPADVRVPHDPNPPSRNGPFEIAAAHLARVAPLRVSTQPIAVIVFPDLRALQNWLFSDVATVLAAWLAIAAVATLLGTRWARTERRRLEATAEERRTAAMEYQRFLADAGHELRTPLTIASGYLDILSSQLEHAGPDLTRAFQGVKTETARMRGLVEKMLLLARLETPVSVPSLLDAGDVAEMSLEAMRARFPERELIFARDGRASVVIDRDDLYEAVRNLIENALKYAPESPVVVTAATRDGCAYVSVADQGLGIPPGEREAIFERFYRGQRRGDAEGSGLGLAIVRRVADRWSGTIALESKPFRTVFTLRFPLADEET